MVAILVVLTILVCVTVDALIQWSYARRRQLVPAKVVLQTSPLAAFTPEAVSLPGGIFVDPAHTWVKVSANGKTSVGLDDFLLKAIGRIDEILLPEIGAVVRQGETLFTVRQGERKIEVPAPIDGVVEARNVNLAALQSDPYEQGWLCGLKPENLAKNLRRLSIAEEATAWIKEEVRRFQEFVFSRPFEHMALGRVMQDGGVPATGLLEFMDDETWNQFSAEFVARS
jgi:glycine cleavage system H protein